MPGGDDPMAAIVREVREAEEEGIIFHPHHTLTRLIVRDGRVRGVELTAVRKLPGEGRGSRRVAFEGTEVILDADLVVPAVGEIVEPFGLEKLLAGRGHLAAGPTGAVPGEPGLFAGGDAAGGLGTVSAAIGSGRRAAAAIDAHFRRQAAVAETVPPPLGVEHLNLSYFDHLGRREPPIVPAAARSPEVEVEGSLDYGAVHEEARRCLSCGNCMACDNCWTFCPEPAVLKTRTVAADGSHYVFDYDFCKGCGLCARECPTGFIAMIDEAAA
jgi:2-oxoacid:acceptor oxidoreductase delta subunit (pyruvate/2-ketoisovalerate family)